MFNLILSKTNNNIIGRENDLLVKIKEDLKYFYKITTYTPNPTKKNIIIMGYNTWLSIGKKKLKDRINIVISLHHFDEFESDCYMTLEGFINNISKYDYNEIFIIGGSELFNNVLLNFKKLIDKIYITNINYNHKLENNVKYSYFHHNFDNYNIVYNIKKESIGQVYDEVSNDYDTYKLNYNFILYKNGDININDREYNNMCIDILNKDNIRLCRNGETISDFGKRMEFDLIKGFPLLTTKKVSWKTVLKELLWFISGNTDNNVLNSNGVNIWNMNAEEYFNRSMKRMGDLGPIYGFQWRHFGAEYTHCDDNYKGVDQLKYIIDEINNNPNSRRLILSSWNPSDLQEMALPPCHILFQFYIDGDYIDGQLYQRSGDIFLGVPYNISSYSFLLHIIGNITGYIPRKLVHILGDAHIYKDHIKSIEEQITRDPKNTLNY